MTPRKARGTAQMHEARLLLFSTLLTLYLLCPLIAGAEPGVSNEAELNAALADGSRTRIVVASNILISPHSPTAATPIVLNRSLIIEGGLNTTWSTWPKLDFNFASRDRLRLLPGVTLTLRRLVILNIFSRSQQSYDYFASSTSSSSSSNSSRPEAAPVVLWQDVVDRRLLCPPLQGVVDTWRAAPRPANGNGTSGFQAASLDTTPVCGEAGTPGAGSCFSPVMRAADVQADTSQGFRIVWINTLTLCEKFIDDACIQQQGLEGCYLTSIETLLAQRAQAQQTTDAASGGSGDGGSSGLSSSAQTGLIVGCVVGGVLLAAGVALYLWQRQRRADGEAVVAGHVQAAYASKDGADASDDLESGIRPGGTGDTTRDMRSASLHHAASDGAANASAGAAAPASGGVSTAGGAPKTRRGSSTDAGTINSSCPITITDCTTRGSGGLRGSAPVSAEVPGSAGAALGLGGSTSGEVAAAIAAAGIRSGDWRAAVAAVAAKAGQQQHLAQVGPLGDSMGSVGSGMLVLGGTSSSRVAAVGGGGSGGLSGGSGVGRGAGAVANTANASTNPLFSLPETEQGAGSGDAAGTPTAGTPTAAAAAAAAAAVEAGTQGAASGPAAAGAGLEHTGVVLISTTAAAAAAAVSPRARSTGGPVGGSLQSGSFKLLTRLRSLIHRGGSRTPTTLGGTTTSGSGAAAAASPTSPQAARAHSATQPGGQAGGGGRAGRDPLRARAPSGTIRTASAGVHVLAGMLKGLRLGHGTTSDGASTGADSTPTAVGLGTHGARTAAAGAGGPASGAVARDALRPPTRLSLQVSLASGDAHALAAARGSNVSAASGVTGRPSLSDMQRDLERMEGELHREENKRSKPKGAPARSRSGRASLGSKPPAAAGAAAGAGAGGRAAAAGAGSPAASVPPP